MSSNKFGLTEHNRQQYTQYLEDQLEKLSSFMLYQKKQNQKYNQLTELIQDQNEKIKFLNDKVLLLELYQNENIKNQQKLTKVFQNALSLQKKVDKLEMCHFSKGNLQNFEKFQKQILIEANNKIESVREQIFEEIVQIDKKLTKKLSQLIKNSEISTGTYTVRAKNGKKEPESNMSPIETNYSENTKSRVNDFERKMDGSCQNVSPFSNERKISTLERQSFETYHNKVPSIQTEFKDSSVIHHQDRSPISQYLKKQKQYNSSDQNAHLKSHSISTKQFHSEFEIKDLKKQKIKSKKSKSKSKSRSKSQRSVSNSSKLKIVENKKGKSKKSKSTRQGINQSNISRISQKSISQMSEKSRSRSKSAEKMYKKQKKYLMCCKKDH